MNSTFSADIMASRTINTQDCKTVCLALGPYRNLTTLTAATLFLHPNCQVLNHAGTRIFGNKEVDFLSNYNKDRFNRFIQFAIQISGGGTKGDFGGSIIHSHAFDAQYGIKNIFAETGEELTKERINCLFWKESLATSNLIHEKHIDLNNILINEERLRFLMPIRNPLDCAISNIKIGLVNRFRCLNKDPTIHEVLQEILNEIHWFASCNEKYPDRFFYYFEHSISQEMIIKLATFLRLAKNETWLSMAQTVMVVKSSYQHDNDLLDFYQKCVIQQFSHFPAFAKQLLVYAQS